MTLSVRVQRALERAAEAADGKTPVRGGGLVRRHVAVGDPQAPIEDFLAILDDQEIVGDDGWVAPGVHLVSMGDHFDWGGRRDRERAARSGRLLLAWLASHTRDDVTILLGNHDLARVGELASLNDAVFREVQGEADAAYFDGQPLRDEPSFRRATGLSSWELASRDFSTFDVTQRELVARLLREGRFRVACAAAPDLLLCHAGVTTRELAVLGLPAGSSAEAIATALDEALARAVAAWRVGPLSIAGLHEPGTAAGEGTGMFYHRPDVANGARAASAESGRRYDVATLPTGLVQAIGHVRDAKARKLLGVDAGDEAEGAIHHAVIRGANVAYGRGIPAPTPDAATLLFLDGGMRHARRADYELFDVAARAPARSRR